MQQVAAGSPTTTAVLVNSQPRLVVAKHFNESDGEEKERKGKRYKAANRTAETSVISGGHTSPVTGLLPGQEEDNAKDENEKQSAESETLFADAAAA